MCTEKTIIMTKKSHASSLALLQSPPGDVWKYPPAILRGGLLECPSVVRRKQTLLEGGRGTTMPFVQDAYRVSTNAAAKAVPAPWARPRGPDALSLASP